MEVEERTETVERKIFETKTHSFKISADKLETMEEMEDDKKYNDKMSALIQKGLRQTVEKANGKDWEESYKAIFQKITGQKTL